MSGARVAVDDLINPAQDLAHHIKPMAEIRPEECESPQTVERSLQGLVGSEIQLIDIAETEDSTVLSFYTDKGFVQIHSLKTEHVGLAIRLAPEGQLIDWSRAKAGSCTN
jgi:hypothetical protein